MACGGPFRARRKFRGKFRQRRDVEMIVMTVRDQRDIDRRQRLERNSRVVAALRSGPPHRRGARRPHRIDQNIQSGRLDQPAGVADIRQSHLVAPDPRRRRVGMRARRPFGPGMPLPARAELPAQQFTERFRRRAVGIEKPRAVEMIGHRSGIGFHSVNPDRRHADDCGRSCQHSKNTTAGNGHGPIGPKNARFGKGIVGRPASRKRHFAASFLDFRG